MKLDLLGKPTPKQTFFRKVIFGMHYFWMRSKLMKDWDCRDQINFVWRIARYCVPMAKSSKDVTFSDIFKQPIGHCLVKIMRSNTQQCTCNLCSHLIVFFFFFIFIYCFTRICCYRLIKSSLNPYLNSRTSFIWTEWS